MEMMRNFSRRKLLPDYKRARDTSDVERTAEVEDNDWKAIRYVSVDRDVAITEGPVVKW
jgi:hypothetical protein